MLAYLIENLVNGKKYVGIASSLSHLQRRWNAHRNPNTRASLVRNAIRLYGVENFSFEIVACSNSWGNLCLTEIALIAQHGSFAGDKNGYNATRGGDGSTGRKVRHSPEARAKMGAGRKGKLVSPETRQKQSLAKKGKKLSAQHAANAGAARRGKPHSPEHRAKIAAAHVGMKASDATRARISAVQVGKTRKPHSAETRKKLSAAALARYGAATADKEISQCVSQF